METVNLHQPMTWKQFKILRPEVAEEYLTYLRDEINLTKKEIAEMMGVSTGAFYNIPVKVSFPRNSPIRTTEQQERISAFLGREQQPAAEAPVPQSVSENRQPTISLPRTTTPPGRGELVFTGTPADIFSAATLLLGSGCYNMTISFSKASADATDQLTDMVNRATGEEQ